MKVSCDGWGRRARLRRAEIPWVGGLERDRTEEARVRGQTLNGEWRMVNGEWKMEMLKSRSVEWPVAGSNGPTSAGEFNIHNSPFDIFHCVPSTRPPSWSPVTSRLRPREFGTARPCPTPPATGFGTARPCPTPPPTGFGTARPCPTPPPVAPRLHPSSFMLHPSGPSSRPPSFALLPSPFALRPFCPGRSVKSAQTPPPRQT
jgi:hypothetical protein